MYSDLSSTVTNIDKKAVYADKGQPPAMLPVLPDGIPTELKAERRWVMWKLLWKENKAGGGKWDKPPLTTAGRAAKSNDPATWTSFDEVMTAYQTGRYTGIGFILGDGWAGVDLDGVRDRPSGQLMEWAERAVALGGYAEVSPSGTGLKMLGRGEWSAGWNRKKHPHGGEVEVYTSGRYFTVTGHAIGGGTSLDLQPTLNASTSLFAPPSPPAPPPEPPAGASPDSDDELLEKIRRSRQGAKFTALFDRGDLGEYGGDESRAAMALVAMLAWWCRGDADRIDRLFRRSALMRDKWDSRRKDSTWGRDTIDKVLRGQTEFYIAEGRKPKGNPRRRDDGDGGGGGGDDQEGKTPVAELLANIAAAETELWHDSTGAAFATVGRRTMAVRSTQFKLWLTARYRGGTDGKVPGKEALGSAAHAIEARATLDGPEHEAHVRVACHGGRVYLHLADAADTVIEVDAGGWRECEAPPVRFRRTGSVRPLPRPQPGGSMDDLRELLGLADPDQFALVVGFVCGVLRPSGPTPLLVLTGEQGSGKSTLARTLKGLMDPTAAALRCEPREIRDLMIATRGNHLLCLDNLSELKPWQSDALCRLATGGGFATRGMYTDEDEVIFDARRPAILTGIEDFVTRGDLLERSIPVHLGAIAPSQRTTEAELAARFDLLHPRVLGALLDRVAGGLRELPRVRVEGLPRMADFVSWAVACERGAGEPPRFLQAYQANQAAAHAQALDGSSLASAVCQLVAHSGVWEGTATSLLEAIQEFMPDYMPQDWPRSPNAITGPLRRLAPNLRKVHGIDVTFHKSTDAKRTRLIKIHWPAAEEERKRRWWQFGFPPDGPLGSAGGDPAAAPAPPVAPSPGQESSDDPDGADGLGRPSPPVSREQFDAFLNLH